MSVLSHIIHPIQLLILKINTRIKSGRRTSLHKSYIFLGIGSSSPLYEQESYENGQSGGCDEDDGQADDDPARKAFGHVRCGWIVVHLI